MRYILVAREKDHKSLNEYFWAGEGEDVEDFTEVREKKNLRYRFMNKVPLNDSHPDLLDTKTNKMTKWMWVTDFDVTKENVREIMRRARTRWKIENETFNALKTKGYNFEHNYDHGYNGLANVFAGLMLLAFLVDQILESCNETFRAVMERCGSRIRCWVKCQAIFFGFQVTNWDAFYKGTLAPPPFIL